MTLKRLFNKLVKLFRIDFFFVRKEWIVFKEKLFEDTKDYERGDMANVLNADGFLTRVRKFDRDISVKNNSFMSINGEISIQPLIKATEEYCKSKNSIFRRYHSKRCYRNLKCSLKNLNVRQLSAAKKEVEGALCDYEFYYPSLSWKDYNKGEEFFLRHIGRAILEIL